MGLRPADSGAAQQTVSVRPESELTPRFDVEYFGYVQTSELAR